MRKKNGKSHAVVAKKAAPAKPVKTFDLDSLTPEDNVTILPKSEGTVKMYEKLDALQVGQSYRMPMDMYRIFTNAKVTHKRLNKKVFISRKLDKYNFRCWRLADNTILSTRKVTKKTK